MKKSSSLILLCLLIVVRLVSAAELAVKHHAVIREGPSSTARKIGTAEAGDRFELLNDNPTNQWYKIEFNNSEGWISARWVEIEGQTSSGIIRIASFNAKRLGHGFKDYPLTARVLSSYDLVALQEVMTDSGVENLVNELEKLDSVNPTDWKYEISEPVGRGSYKEHYAYVWKSDMVSLTANSSYLVDDEPEDHFIREPYVSTFKAGKFDFTMISSHLIWGDSKAQRREEAKALAAVYGQVQDNDPNENDVILVGDFNLPPTDKGWKEIKKIEGMSWLIKPPAKTTIGTKKISSLYDNIWFQSGYLTEFTGNSGTYEFMHDLIDDENVYEAARSLVSDHVPVWGEFSTEKDDD